MRVGGQLHAPAALPPGKTRYPGPVWTGAENLAPTGIRSPDPPARSESLYRLSYRGPRAGEGQQKINTQRNWRTTKKSVSIKMWCVHKEGWGWKLILSILFPSPHHQTTSAVRTLPTYFLGFYLMGFVTSMHFINAKSTLCTKPVRKTADDSSRGYTMKIRPLTLI